MLNFILNAIADFCDPLCTGLHIRFIIYLCSMYVDICFWYLFFTVVVLVFGFFVVYAFVALTSFVKSINYYRIVFDFLFLSFAWLNAYIEILT